jgi:hypothetical protein
LPTPPAPPSSEPPANPAVAACKAEYQQLGATGFAAKYGQSDAGLKACVVAHGGTPPPPNGTEPPKAGDPTRSVAQALCAAEARSLGKDGFQAQYGSGKDGLAACAKAQAAKAQSILAACKATAGSSESALKQCVLAALKPGARS